MTAQKLGNNFFSEMKINENTIPIKPKIVSKL